MRVGRHIRMLQPPILVGDALDDLAALRYGVRLHELREVVQVRAALVEPIEARERALEHLQCT